MARIVDEKTCLFCGEMHGAGGSESARGDGVGAAGQEKQKGVSECTHFRVHIVVHGIYPSGQGAQGLVLLVKTHAVVLGFVRRRQNKQCLS